MNNYSGSIFILAALCYNRDPCIEFYWHVFFMNSKSKHHPPSEKKAQQIMKNISHQEEWKKKNPTY